jgi:hypothetical protein
LAEGDGDALQPVLRMVDATIARLSKCKFASDPIVGPRYSAITSIVSSAYKRHGKIIEEALAATLRQAPDLQVWSEPRFPVSEAAERLASSDETALGARLPYSPTGHARTLQVDLFVYDATRERLGAYESKRGFGYHDSGKIRSMRRDMRCMQMLARSYGENRGLVVKEANARMIFYYGQCSIGEPWAITGKGLDGHFGFPVWESVERVNGYFQEKLDALLASV